MWTENQVAALQIWETVAKKDFRKNSLVFVKDDLKVDPELVYSHFYLPVSNPAVGSTIT